MRDIVVIEYMSVDGVIQAPGHAGEDTDGGFAHGGWTGPFMAEHRRYISEAFQTAGAFLFGRRTYEIFAEYWPTVTDEDDEIARALNTLPKYVASATLTEQQWTHTTIIGDIVQDVGKLKKEPGRKIIVAGSARLTRTLLRHGLVDEYQLWVHPVVLGTGKRLFTEDTPMTTLRLVDSKTTSNGLIILTYAPAAPLHRSAGELSHMSGQSRVMPSGNRGAPDPAPALPEDSPASACSPVPAGPVSSARLPWVF